jgi:ABC-type multidrug transport system ATPase subunit
VENAFAFVSQLDKHAPRLTVEETFDFAFQCKSGGRLIHNNDMTPEEKVAEKRALDNKLVTDVILTALGLKHVKDTFVGDNNVRGVSGGQRRRVTVGEMLMSTRPFMCGDEISTGLDAAST